MTNFTLTNVLFLFLVLEAGFCLSAKVSNKTRGRQDDAELIRHNDHDHDCTRPKVNIHFQYTFIHFIYFIINDVSQGHLDDVIHSGCHRFVCKRVTPRSKRFLWFETHGRYILRRFTIHILLVFINQFKFSDVCCTYMNNYYQPGDNITTSLASDNCTQVRFTYLTVWCIRIKNFSIGTAQMPGRSQWPNN